MIADQPTRVCLVGAGFIAQVHAEALLGLPGLRIAAVVDSDAAAARALAARWRIPRVFADVEQALREDTFDRAHVMVPPPHHAAVTLPLLRAGRAVLLEKPLATSADECRSLLQASRQNGAVLGVNQNFVFHPAFLRLRQAIERKALGPLRSVSCIYNMPLRQMAARQFGHWMFYAPVNLLLEQAVHPLSQIAALAGPIEIARAVAGPAIETTPGQLLYPTVDVALSSGDVPAQLRLAVGQSFPFWQFTAVCDDGVLIADMLANRCFSHARTKWLDAVDGVVSGSRTGLAILRESWRNGLDYAASTLHLKPRSDAFFLSMRGSIAAFHGALDAGQGPENDAPFGAMLVSACEQVRDLAFAAPARPEAVPIRSSPTRGGCDVAILGGTGFIGAHIVRRFVADGARVAVMARSVRNLSAMFDDPQVVLHRGDIRDAEAVRRALRRVPVVVNLAHGGGGSFEQIREAMVGGARVIAEACLEAKVRLFVHVGSIASLYLGSRRQRVTGETPPDPRAEQRADYARAKAICDRLLLTMRAERGLPVCILRPGLVVGEGGTPFHSGLGSYNNDQHCLGWNNGRNPLPFVLVEDVAAAILQAVRAGPANGRCYNLVGDVRLSARDYIAALAVAMQRPLRFHPQSPTRLWLTELGKWGVKLLTGRAVPRPTLRDLRSRGLCGAFDCDDAKRDLGWRPVSDQGEFLDRAILVHARS